MRAATALAAFTVTAVTVFAPLTPLTTIGIAVARAGTPCAEMDQESQAQCNKKPAFTPCTYYKYLPNGCKPCNEVAAQPPTFDGIINGTSCDPNVWREADGTVVPR